LIQGIKEDAGEPLVVDPGAQGGNVGKDILIRELPPFPKEPPESQVSPEVRVRQGVFETMQRPRDHQETEGGFEPKLDVFAHGIPWAFLSDQVSIERMLL